MKAPSVLVDGYNLSGGFGTGIATYTRCLSTALRELGADVSVLYGKPVSPTRRDPLLDEVEFFDEPRRTGNLQLVWRVRQLVTAASGFVKAIDARRVPVSGIVVPNEVSGQLRQFSAVYNATNIFTLAFRHFALTGRCLTVRVPDHIDIAHWTSPIPIKIAGAKNIYTFHDLIPLKLPYTTLDRKALYLRLVRRLAATADHIVTVSHHSKTDIVALLGISEQQISVTYQAVDVSPPSRDEEVQTAALLDRIYQIKAGKYLLFVGAIEPKKNIGRLLEAFLMTACDMPLVIVGPKAWKSEGELAVLGSAGTAARERVKLLGFVPRRNLAHLIRGARALLFPSLYEGFGLPVVEAMALGTPVVASNTSSLPEIAGGAALYVDPYSVVSISSAIEQIAVDDALAADLHQKGPEQAARFSMDAYTARLSDMYQRLGLQLNVTR